METSMRYGGVMLLAALAGGAVFAGEAAKPDPAKAAIVDPAQGGVEFALQGEYEGTIAGARAGVQVISLGKGQFRAAVLAGGLPGAGWDTRSRAEARGTLDGQKAVFGTGGYAFSIADGRLTGQTDSGQAMDLARIVRQSPTMGAKPPAGAIVLFDGTSLEHWRPGAKMDEQRKLLGVGAFTKQEFRDFALHLEFILPYQPVAGGQGRGNSGVYIQNRYETQILDSFGLVPQFGDCGALYRTQAPSINMCLPPLQWQTYDIDFTAARFADGKKTANARITVRHNGVLIHDDFEIPNKTGAGKAEAPEPGPIQLQNHSNPVFFRNVWIVPK
jgi:hypothetical protein